MNKLVSLTFLLTTILIQQVQSSGYRPSKLVQNKSKSDVITINPENYKKGSIYMGDIFDRSKLIKLETTSDCLIEHISQLKYHSDTIYILGSIKSPGVFVFTKNGKFVRKYCRMGKGPGEYLSPSDFSFDFNNRKIYILDSGKQVINEYSLNSTKLIKSIKIKEAQRITAFEKFRNHFITDIDSYTYKHTVQQLSLDGKLETSFLNSGIYQGYKGLHIRHEDDGRIIKSDNKIFFVSEYNNTIFKIDGTNTYPYLTFNNKNFIKKGEFNYHKVFNSLQLKKGQEYNIMNFRENSKYISFNWSSRLNSYLFYNKKTKTVYSGKLKDNLNIKNYDKKHIAPRILFMNEDFIICSKLDYAFCNKVHPLLISYYKKMNIKPTPVIVSNPVFKKHFESKNEFDNETLVIYYFKK